MPPPPPYVLNFYIQPPSVLLSFSPIPSSNFPTPSPLQVIIARSLKQRQCMKGRS